MILTDKQTKRPNRNAKMHLEILIIAYAYAIRLSIDKSPTSMTETIRVKPMLIAARDALTKTYHCVRYSIRLSIGPSIN